MTLINRERALRALYELFYMAFDSVNDDRYVRWIEKYELYEIDEGDKLRYPSIREVLIAAGIPEEDIEHVLWRWIGVR